jgi:mannose-1-phosphate guanylyltransferase
MRASDPGLRRLAMPTYQSERAAVILAGGDGRRLCSLSREIFGKEIPKQFCRFWGEATLLEQTRRRSASLIEPSRTLTVLTANHARFYQPLLEEMKDEPAIIQPSNRGTAPAILYALMRLKKIAPDCSVAMFPSDHFVDDEKEFMRHVEAAFRAVDARPEETILLGVEAAEADPQYGWIEPGPFLANECEPVRQVRCFWEKPPAEIAERLMSDGCLWSTFVIVARLSTFLGLFLIAMPELYEAFRAVEPEIDTPAEEVRMRRLYERIRPSNFSEEVLVKCPFNLAVLQLNGVEWIDLGEPHHVARLSRRAMDPRWRAGEFLPKPPTPAGPGGTAGNP